MPKAAPRGRLDVLEQPLDLGGRRSRGRATSPVRSRTSGSCPARFSSSQRAGGAPVLPDERPVDGLAGGAIPCDDRLALVGDPDRRRARRRLSRLRRSPRWRPQGHVPDLGRVVLHPARGAGSAVRTPSRRAPRSRRRRRRPGRWCRSSPGRSRGSQAEAKLPSRQVGTSDVEELSSPVQEASRLREVVRCCRSSSTSPSLYPRPDGVDRHRGLQPVAGGQWQDVAEHLGAHRPLTGQCRPGAIAATALDRPAGKAERDPESAAHPVAKRSDGEVTRAALDRLDQEAQLSRRGAQVRIAEQERRWLRVGGATHHGLGRRGHVAPLAMRATPGYHLGPVEQGHV